jgi:hypothetical protein
VGYLLFSTKLSDYYSIHGGKTNSMRTENAVQDYLLDAYNIARGAVRRHVLQILAIQGLSLRDLSGP